MHSSNLYSGCCILMWKYPSCDVQKNHLEKSHCLDEAVFAVSLGLLQRLVIIGKRNKKDDRRTILEQIRPNFATRPLTSHVRDAEDRSPMQLELLEAWKRVSFEETCVFKASFYRFWVARCVVMCFRDLTYIYWMIFCFKFVKLHDFTILSTLPITL